VSLASKPPKRKQIVEAVLNGIRKGELPPGGRLAPVREMSSKFGVSLSVVQNAMRELIGNGMVECRGASGFYIRENPENGAAPETGQTRPPQTGKIFLCCHHHSDLVWRRGYDEYKKIRERQINLLLEHTKKHPEFQFFADQSEVMRAYLEDNPGRLPEIKRLISGGNIELLGGLCIPDLNMCQGESLVRNLLLGRKYYRETFGVEPDTAGMTDAFGMCAQLPQILVKAGYRFLIPGRMPNLPPEIDAGRPFVWRGLDGTPLTVANPTAFISHAGYVFNVPVEYPPETRLADMVSNLKSLPGDVLAVYMTEEELIHESLFRAVTNANAAGGAPVEFGRVSDFLARINSAEIPVFSGELNPCFTGCYTTRIGVKQAVRLAENQLLTAETLMAVANRSSSADEIWRELALAQFHDAICGCHTDSASAEISQKLGRVLNFSRKETLASMETLSGGGVTVFNPHNFSGPALVSAELPDGLIPDGVTAQRDGSRVVWTADLPACGLRGFALKKGPLPKAKTLSRSGEHGFSTGFFDVSFNGPWPVIRSKTLNRNIFGSEGFGEILFRCDHGSMWTEMFLTDYLGKENQTETLEELTEGDVFIRAVTSGKVLPGPSTNGNLGCHWPGFESLSFRKEYIFPKALDYFKLKLTLDWKGSNTKISVRFPAALNVSSETALYETPFGVMDRRPYFEVPYEHAPYMRKLARQSDYNTARGDWPALNWVDYSDADGGLAVANTGTPGHQLIGGDILISLLRSGTAVADGGMTPQPGALDNGVREYEFAFCAHKPDDLNAALRLGRVLNRPPVAHVSEVRNAPVSPRSLVSWNASSVAMSAFFRSPDGSLILRLYEALGRQASVRLSFGAGNFEVTECAMDGSGGMECPPEIKFAPFEIKTLKLT
jgi:alpha-mannosidase